VTKGTQEPYRMFTSRVEYRLIVREDNADKRMAPYAYQFGLISQEDLARVEKKYALIERTIHLLRETRVSPGTSLDAALAQHQSAPLRNTMTLGEILKRPEITFDMIEHFFDGEKELPRALIEQIEYGIKYEGFITRQKKDVEKFKYLENIKIPADIDYTKVSSLSYEIKQKLQHFLPTTLGQANRISGVTPAALSILMVYLKKRSLEQGREA
jgi:tRNA uridine 5-carboxymethylaminomethyl modification enzyme